MLTYPNIGPDLIHLGRLRVRWYGIMYVLGFVAGRFILRRLCRQGFLRMHQDRVDDFLIALFAGMLLGARILYMLVYYAATPESPFVWWYTPFAVWEGGLAFHGGALGMFAAIWWFGRRNSVRFWNLGDALALAAPVGIALGRIGNFINGRETTVPWAMQFPIRDFDGSVLGWTTPRHPSQLYECICEGILTFLVVWMFKRRAKHQGAICGVGIAWYAIARFLIEFFREKDEQLSYYFGWMTMGQILCAIMFAIGVFVYLAALRRALPVNAPLEQADTGG
jgi:phosphatidylglycerol:prolipoprotein diacylglycerol transferase